VVTPLSDHAWRNVRTRSGTNGWVASTYLADVEPSDFADPAGGLGDGLSMEPDHQFTFAELWPVIEAATAEYGADPQVMAGVIEQESTRHNYRVHLDGTGHGLAGLDDHGLLPDFERWSGLAIGRGATAAIIPPGMQIAYLALTLAAYSARLGSPYQAARAWHRGESQWGDAAGDRYEALVRGHITRLFA
jgi:hypothetical protein